MKSENKSSKERKSNLKQSIECGEILVDFADTPEPNAEIRDILFRGTKPFRGKLPIGFSKKSILLPDDSYPQYEMTEILEDLKNRKDLNGNDGISFYLKSYNSHFVRKWRIDEEGNLIKKDRSSKRKDLSWYHIIAYNLVHFMKLKNYSKYIRRCKDCGHHRITEKKLKDHV